MIKTEDIARVCHEANRAYSMSIADYTHKNWDDSPQWVKDSCINGVSFLLLHPLSNPIDMHDKWMKDKLADGWKWGPRKDAEKKEHPCMLEYHELPEDQRVKDVLFSSIVKALAKA